jgi:TonB family protein
MYNKPMHIFCMLCILFLSIQNTAFASATPLQTTTIIDTLIPVKVAGTPYTTVDEMPRFPGCESSSKSIEDKKSCANQKMMRYVSSNIRYPARARENGTSGMAVISFVVEENGTISNIKPLRDPGSGLANEAMRVVRSMPRWIPGKKGGKAVAATYTLPVRFRLSTTKKRRSGIFR